MTDLRSRMSWGSLLAVGLAFGGISALATWLAVRVNDDPHPPLMRVGQVKEEATVEPPAPNKIPSLTEIAGIAVDSHRNDALYDLVADADTTRVREMLAELATLDPAPHRPDLARVLYIRFAAIDPEAAVDHVIKRAYRSSWLTAVFRAWAHADLDAVVARAQTLKGHAKELATRAILELELPERRREAIAFRLDAKDTLASIRADEELRGETDFTVAWQKALSFTDDTERQRRLEEIVAAWAEEEPEVAMAAATDLARQALDDAHYLSPGLLLQNRVIEIWASADTEAAIAWITNQESGRTRQSTTTTLIMAVVEENLGDAISALDRLPKDLVGIAQRGLVLSLGGRDVNADDLDTLVDWYAYLEPESQTFLAPFLSQTMVLRDRERAFDWAVSLGGDAQRQAVGNVTWRIGLNDPDLAKRLVETIDDEALQRIAAVGIIGEQVRNDPRAALEWAESLTRETVRLELVRVVFQQWSNADPDEAVREVLRLRHTSIRDDAAFHVASKLVREEYTRSEGSRVDLSERLFDAIRAADVRRRLAEVLHGYYTATEPDQDKAKYYAAIMSNDG